MTPAEPGPRELSSWKEVAAYLNVSVRTAQYWESERGLPVRRLPGGRGPISVEIASLEEWKNSRLTPGNGTEAAVPDLPEDHANGEDTSGSVPTWRAKSAGLWPLYAAAALVLIAAIVVADRWALRGSPSQFRLTDHSLRIFDDRDHLLWQKNFPGVTLTPTTDFGRTSVIFADLDGDGKKEVLFAARATPIGAGSPLICYSHDGHERWRFIPGKTVRTATEEFAPPYEVHSFLAGPFGSSGALRIVVSSTHFPYYPAQVALLDANGHLIGEYWHSGHLCFMLVQDGKILLAGVHNPSKMATLVRLRPDQIRGASVEENPAYQIQGFPPAGEDARVFFPRSCINLRFEPFLPVWQAYLTADGVVVETEHHINGPTTSGVFYHLSKDLTLTKLGVGSGFELDHRQLHERGELDHAWTQAEETALKKITYGSGDTLRAHASSNMPAAQR